MEDNELEVQSSSDQVHSEEYQEDSEVILKASESSEDSPDEQDEEDSEEMVSESSESSESDLKEDSEENTTESESETSESSEDESEESTEEDTTEDDTTEENTTEEMTESMSVMFLEDGSAVVYGVDGSVYPLYESYEEFMASPLYVTRYENEILSKLEFIQYALALLVALIFLLIFRRK